MVVPGLLVAPVGVCLLCSVLLLLGLSSAAVGGLFGLACVAFVLLGSLVVVCVCGLHYP